MVRWQRFISKFFRWLTLGLFFWAFPHSVQANPWLLDADSSGSHFFVYRDSNLFTPIRAITIGHELYGTCTEYVTVEIQMRDEWAVQRMTYFFPVGFHYEIRRENLAFVIARPPSQRMHQGFLMLFDQISSQVQSIDTHALSGMRILLKEAVDGAQLLNLQQKLDTEQLLLGIQVSTQFHFELPYTFRHEDLNRELPSEGWKLVDAGTIHAEECCGVCLDRLEDGVGADLIGEFGAASFKGARHPVQTRCGKYLCQECLLRAYKMIPRCPFCRSCMPGIPAPSDNESNGQRSTMAR